MTGISIKKYIELNWAERTTRKPKLLLRLCGCLLLRLAQRKLFSLLLFHEPPRTTVCFDSTPFGLGDKKKQNNILQSINYLFFYFLTIKNVN